MSPDAPRELVAESLPSSVARIRRFATDTCQTLGSSVDCDVVALLVSEVATNALVHGDGQVRVRVLPTQDGVRIEVSDSSPDAPRRREAGDLDEGGRGIALVEALAGSWGCDPTADGKTVWFELGGAPA